MFFVLFTLLIVALFYLEIKHPPSWRRRPTRGHAPLNMEVGKPYWLGKKNGKYYDKRTGEFLETESYTWEEFTEMVENNKKDLTNKD